jgi:ABC-type tungstate transport system permease subunit
MKSYLMIMSLGMLGVAVSLVIAANAGAADKITCASTTSTQNSGLFEVLLPAFKKATGIDVAVVAVGTGQALEIGRRVDADVLFVHDPEKEEKFVAEGFGWRRPVMYMIYRRRSAPTRPRLKDKRHQAFKMAASASISSPGRQIRHQLKELKSGKKPASILRANLIT